MTGEITVSNVSVSVANGVCTGTRDADHGRTAHPHPPLGRNDYRLYGRRGRHIRLSEQRRHHYRFPSRKRFFFYRRIRFDGGELEANFLVAVPDASVQKVVIPQQGSPYPLKSTEIRFDMPNGALVVTKTDAASGGVWRARRSS